MEEEWRPVIGYEELYEASSEGRIRSVDREVADRGGVYIAKGKVLKPVMNKGYLRVGLHEEGKTKWFYVHRLVYSAFCGKIPGGYDVNHIDEDKTNNRLENLNLMTRKENNNWGTRTERCSKPVIAFDGDGNVVLEFHSTAEAERNGFHSGHLSACCLGKQKTHKGYRWKYKENA